MTKFAYPKVTRRAVALFNNSTGNHWLAPVLKDGFRHVCVVVESGPHWIFVSPCPDGIRLTTIAMSDFDIATHYKNNGYTVVEFTTSGTECRLPLSLSNCVGAVKAVLGIQKPFMVTPYQLFKYLKANPSC